MSGQDHGTIQDQIQVRTVNSAKDFATWVGERYYTATTFIREAQTLGVCRRVPFVPKGIRFGKSRIFFISRVVGESEKFAKKVTHKKDVDEILKYRSFRLDRKSLREKGVELVPHVIGYGVVTGVLVVGANKIVEELVKAGHQVIHIPPSKVSRVPLRGCGTLKIGGVYLVDSTTLNSLAESGVVDIEGIEISPSTFTVFDPPIPAPGLPRWRGLKVVDGEAILARKPWQEWFPD